MKISNFLIFLFLAVFSLSFNANADGEKNKDKTEKSETETDTDEGQEAKEPKEIKHLDELKAKYQLDDTQIESLKNSGMPLPQLIRVSEYAALSGKSVDEVLAMRQEQDMGWGKIAKELGIEAKVNGSAISEFRKERNGERREAHLAQKEAKLEQRQERQVEKMALKQERLERRQSRRESKEKQN